MPTKKTQDALDDLRNKIKDLEERAKVEDAAAPIEIFATDLHETLCHYEHTEACGWFYEFHSGYPDWSGNSHRKYLSMARKLEKIIDPDLALEVYKIGRA